MANKMQYVRLGSSGLKVSRIILGCMSYGTPEWQDWVLPEEEGLKHIKVCSLDVHIPFPSHNYPLRPRTMQESMHLTLPM
jgi:hypothetical protein